MRRTIGKTDWMRRLLTAIEREHWSKVLIVALLLLALYVYNSFHRSTGVPLYGEGMPDISQSAVVHYIDVGQADAACIVLPGGEVLLIDAGANASEPQLLAYLERYGISRIDCLVLTHPHEDHIGGADAVLRAYDVKSVLLTSSGATSTTYDYLLTSIEAEGSVIYIASPGDRYTFGEASFSVLGPHGDTWESLNNASIVLRFDFGDTSFLFTGDAESEEEAAVLSYDIKSVSADVLKVAHHGSQTSTTRAFLDAVAPRIAVISCGTYNEYGHPHDSVIDSLTAHTSHILRTDQHGSIRIYTDGERLWAQGDS